MIYDMGYDKFPVCIAKTQYSFSTDPKCYGVAKDFDVNVSDIRSRFILSKSDFVAGR